MSMTDPVADLLSRVRNALQVKHDRLDVPTSKIKVAISKLLKQEGYIHDFEQLEVEGKPVKDLRIYLSYNEEGVPAIRHLARVSKPGRRVYRSADEIRPVLNGLGVSLVSTSKGLLSDQEARRLRVGGEILCEIW